MSSLTEVEILAYSAARTARETFPEWFAEKSDLEIINEIAAAVRRSGEWMRRQTEEWRAARL